MLFFVNWLVTASEHTISTPGTIDTHTHFISLQRVIEAIYSGTTTMVGGGIGPAYGNKATTCTQGPWNVRRMMEAVQELPLNFGFLGKGNDSLDPALIEQIAAGAWGLKLNED